MKNVDFPQNHYQSWFPDGSIHCHKSSSPKAALSSTRSQRSPQAFGGEQKPQLGLYKSQREQFDIGTLIRSWPAWCKMACRENLTTVWTFL